MKMVVSVSTLRVGAAALLCAHAAVALRADGEEGVLVQAPPMKLQKLQTRSKSLIAEIEGAAEQNLLLTR